MIWEFGKHLFGWVAKGSQVGFRQLENYYRILIRDFRMKVDGYAGLRRTSVWPHNIGTQP